MKQESYSLFEGTGDLTLQEVSANILMAAALGLLIFLSYAISHRGTIYSRKFNASLVILTILTGTVMTVIGNNIALSLGMVGALSIVRFRTAIKDSRDTVYIFWTIVAGICCGVGDYTVATVGSGVTFAALLLLGMIKSENRNRQSVIQAHVFKLFHHKAILRVCNTTEGTVELIFEISSSLLKKVEKETMNITDSIYNLGGINYVNLVTQNDEVSN